MDKSCMNKQCINKNYRVGVKVPLGIRNGFLRLHIYDSEISGQLELLGKTEKVEGSITADGTMHFKGLLTTPIRSVEYVADGKMEDDSICLHLTSGLSHYTLNGTLINEEEGEIAE